MSKQIEAMKLALEALEKLWLLGDQTGAVANPAITALREALMSGTDGAQSRSDEEQPAPATELREQEPVQQGILARKWILHGGFADVASFDSEGVPSFYGKESVAKFQKGQLSEPCKGKNCGSLNGWLHSAECRAEHEAQYTTPQAQPAQQEPVALPCCGYTDASAVKWNPYNQVVQCHNCGQVYTTSQAQPTYKDSTPHLSVGESSFESWFGVYALNLQCVSSKQMARDAYAAGMGDPLVAPAAQPAREPLTEWQPIETAQKHGEICVAEEFTPGRWTFNHAWWNQETEEWQDEYGDFVLTPTLWMPLPCAQGITSGSATNAKGGAT